MRVGPAGGIGKTARVCGSLLGAACGDAIGAPFEGRSHVDEQCLLDWSRSTDIHRYTDDTAMQRVRTVHLVDNGGRVDQELLAREFGAEWDAEPHRGYAPGRRRSFGRRWPGTTGAA